MSTLGRLLSMRPIFAHFRSDPDEFRSAALNRLDRADIIHVKYVEIDFEIDRPLHAAAQVFEQLVAQAAPFNLLTIHEEAAVSDPSASSDGSGNQAAPEIKY